MEVARKAKEKLEAKNKNGKVSNHSWYAINDSCLKIIWKKKIGFLRRNSNGTTGYHFLKSEDDDDTEKTVTIGKILFYLYFNILK